MKAKAQAAAISKLAEVLQAKGSGAEGASAALEAARLLVAREV